MNEPTFQRCFHDRKNPYVMISREMAQDKSISPKAKGVLLYLFSLPEDWKIYHSQLQDGLGVGEDYVNSAMDELLKSGYAERSRERINGMYQPYKYIIREFKKCSPNRENRPGSTGPVNPALQSKEEESKEKQQQQRARAAEESSPYVCDSAAVSSSKQFHEEQIAAYVEQSSKPKPFVPHVYDCLLPIDIPDEEKIWITKKYNEELVKNATEWATSPDNPPTKSLAASIKFACQKGLSVKNLEVTKTTPYEELQKHFKNGQKYNGADCYFNTEHIAFERGTKNEHVKFDSFFSWKKFDDLCKSFGITFKRNLP